MSRSAPPPPSARHKKDMDSYRVGGGEVCSCGHWGTAQGENNGGDGA